MKKNVKRFIGVFLSVALFFGIGFVLNWNLHSKAEPISGTYGDFEYRQLEFRDDSDREIRLEITKYNGNENVVTIPNTIEGFNVRSIGEEAFKGNQSLHKVIIPDQLQIIQHSAFADCINFSSINLPKQLYALGHNAFGNCINLTSINIPKTSTYWLGVKRNEFGVINYGLNTLDGDKGPFEGCKNLTTVSIEEGTYAIPGYLFKNCTSLSEITIPDSVEIIRRNAFEGCSNLEKVNISNNSALKRMESHCFKDCIKIKEFYLPERLEYLCGFAGCTSLREISIPDSVTTVGQFTDCINLKELVLPSNLKTLIGGFIRGSGITSITLPKSIVEALQAFRQTDVEVLFEEGFEEIPYGMFAASYIEHVDLPDTLRIINNDAFFSDEHIERIREIVIPKSVEYIGRRALGPVKTIYGYTGTAAEDYAIKYNVEFIPLDSSSNNDDHENYWEWGRDNFNFINSKPPFHDPIYVSDEDFGELKKQYTFISNRNMAQHFGAEHQDPEKRKNFISNNLAKDINFMNNKLAPWGGSCYGMSLLSALFKANIVDTNSFGGATTNDLIFNDKLESYINVLHISQHAFPTDLTQTYRSKSIGFKTTINKMFDMGIELSKNNGEQDPFVVRLESSKGGGHAVTCVGAERGSWNNYHKRLLIVDPNYLSAQYIYISDDNSEAYYSGDSNYDKFGYYGSLMSLYVSSANNTNSNTETKRLLSTNKGNLKLISDSGEVDILCDSIISQSGNLALNKYESMDASLDDSSNYLSFLFDDTSEDYILKPLDENGNNIDETGLLGAEVTTSTYTTGVYGVVNKAKLSVNGSLSLEEALGEVTVSMIGEDKPISYLVIDGQASGDVVVTTNNDAVFITGNLSDYSITNLNTEGETDRLDIPGNLDSKVIIENNNLTAMVDMDNNGSYETPIDNIPDVNNDLDPSVNGIVQCPDGRWAMYKNGKVDTTCTTIAQNQYGWWRVENGYVNFDAQGIYQNKYGWWKTTDGKVTFKEFGLFENENGTWRVEFSKVNFKANSIYKGKDGWYKTTNGKVTFKENGIFQNQFGWWYCKNSKVDFDFTGIASNQYGKWYVKSGKVDFTKLGFVKYDGKTYTVMFGKVIFG